MAARDAGGNVVVNDKLPDPVVKQVEQPHSLRFHVHLQAQTLCFFF